MLNFLGVFSILVLPIFLFCLFLFWYYDKKRYYLIATLFSVFLFYTFAPIYYGSLPTILFSDEWVIGLIINQAMPFYILIAPFLSCLFVFLVKKHKRNRRIKKWVKAIENKEDWAKEELAKIVTLFECGPNLDFLLALDSVQKIPELVKFINACDCGSVSVQRDLNSKAEIQSCYEPMRKDDKDLLYRYILGETNICVIAFCACIPEMELMRDIHELHEWIEYVVTHRASILFEEIE